MKTKKAKKKPAKKEKPEFISRSVLPYSATKDEWGNISQYRSDDVDITSADFDNR